ncbi:MAG: hypothetical protein LH702_12090 [Phormidesmis sp. CAN_BIN44]|nr:hypothetical protein [Phormidesmis sp. CAN_BIN44]
MRFRFRYLAIAPLIALLISQTATAQTVQQGRIFRDTTGATFLYGLQPGEPIQAASDFAPARFITANPCGLLIIKRSKTRAVGKIRIEGITINPNTLPIQLIPSCKSGQLEETRLVPFKTSIGDVILPKVANRRYQISILDRPPLRVLKANTCGFLRFPADSLGDQPALPTTTGGMARFKVSTLPLFPQLLCKRKKLYIPSNFPPQLAMSIAPFNPDEWQPSTEPTEDGGSQGGQGSGSPGGSQPPTISPIAPQTFNGSAEQTISFTIADADTPLDQIQLSSNVASFSNDFEYGNFGGSGANRTLTIKPKRSSSNVPLQISASDGTNTTTQTLQLAIAMNPPNPSPSLPRPGYCKGSGGIVATRMLQPNTYYEIYFDDWNRSLRATSNELGNATFAGEVPPDDWSDGMRGMAIHENGEDFYAFNYLTDIPACL